MASAAISISSISGVSRWKIDNTDTTGKTYLIYGGIQTGTGVSVTTFPDCSNAAACDTCNGRKDGGTANKDLACNTTGVFDTTLVTINASGAPNTATKWLLCASNNTEIDSSTSLSIALDSDWGNICQKLGGDSDCTNDLNNQTAYFGAGTDCSSLAADNRVTLKFSTRDIDINTWSAASSSTSSTYDVACTAATRGACNFEAFPGDGKAYLLKDATRILNTGTDAGGSIVYENVVVFYREQQGSETDQDTFDAVTTADAFQRVPIVSGGTIDDSSFVDGLTNEIKYCFKIGSEDSTGNIDYISSADPVAKACVIPSEVVGLLSDKKCFIATAAFGSPLDEHVNRLREFRNQFMVSNWLGRKLVKGYYKVSPPIAAWIAKHEWARASVRTALWPILGWATLSLHLGWFGLLLPFLVLGLGFVILRKRRWA